ncbi:TIGR02117 family protein [Pontibacter actiniarum]|nr:TIGR02117 family protein [Pontibacter actiniarum]
MRDALKKITTGVLWLFMAVLSCVAAFLLAAFLLSSVPVNRGYAQAHQEPVEIFVTSNGVHTDIIVPVATVYIDWRRRLPLHQFERVDSSFRYLAFGWGDRRFYMETPEWSDLRPGVAVTAALWPTRSAMHVTYIRSRPVPNRRQQPVLLSPEQYQRLITYIDHSFVQQHDGYTHIRNTGYTGQDTFYEAHGRFYILKNCNNWVNQGLKRAGVKTALWAPIPYAVMRHLR